MLLLIPGPTPIPEPVRAALAGEAVAHRSAGFEELLRSCGDDLRTVFRTSGPVLPVTGSGTTAFESAMLSLIDPAEPGAVVACHSGKFGERWGQVAERARSFAPGLDVGRVEAAWGSPIGPDALAATLRATDTVSLVTIVHSETSTGAASDLERLAQVVRAEAPDALVVADCITSVGAIPMEQDAWGVDVAVGASQKAFMLPPGLGFVSIGERAGERLDAHRGCAPLSMDLRAWRETARSGRAPFTPPTNLVAGLRIALNMMLEEGVEQIWRRTRRCAEATRSALRAANLSVASASPTDSLTCIEIPDADAVRAEVRERHDVWLAGGQGPWKDRVVRISHMGAVTPADTVRGMTSLFDVLRRRSIADVDPDAGEQSIRESLGEAEAGAA
jgi:aspartate aminotransferase-like enzyme